LTAPLARRPVRYVLTADRLATPNELLAPGYVVVDGDRVLDVGQGLPPRAVERVDLGDRLIVPGYVDVHVHGGAGAQVNAGGQDEVLASVRRLARFHAAHGTTSLLATTVSDSREALRAAVQGIAGVTRDAPVEGAQVLGCHLEGPFLASEYAGAQDPGWLRPPDPSEMEDLLAAGEGTIRLVTLAPELPGANELIDLCRRAGVTVSLGHSAADYETARGAFDAGVRHVTHLFNAMTPVHHRRPGAAIAAIADERVTLELIADGLHVHFAVLASVACLAPERIVLVSDATAAAGLGPGRHRLGGADVEVLDGRVTLAGDRSTLAGSVLTLELAVANLVSQGGVPLLTALRAATLTPARAIGASRKGRLVQGTDADVAVLDPDLSVAATVANGRVVHDPLKLLASVATATGRAERTDQ